LIQNSDLTHWDMVLILWWVKHLLLHQGFNKTMFIYLRTLSGNTKIFTTSMMIDSGLPLDCFGIQVLLDGSWPRDAPDYWLIFKNVFFKMSTDTPDVLNEVILKWCYQWSRLENQAAQPVFNVTFCPGMWREISDLGTLAQYSHCNMDSLELTIVVQFQSCLTIQILVISA